jgi:hypothetical protein
MKPLNIILTSLILLIFNIVSFSQTNNNEQIERKEVTEVLQQFQDGYTKRDTTIISNKY